MDVAHAPGNKPQNYSRRINRFRDLLGQLKPETARRFAETNAIRIFKLGGSNIRSSPNRPSGRATSTVTTLNVVAGHR
jgi:hypothetical protein